MAKPMPRAQCVRLVHVGAVALLFGLATFPAVAQRADPSPNAIDHGADRSGRKDSAPGLNSARSAAQAAGGGVVRLPSGTYTLDSGVFTVGNVTYELDSGTIIRGRYTMPGQNDAITGNMGKSLLKYTASPGTEFGLYASLYVDAASGTEESEKAAAYFRAKTAAPTLAGADRDVLALQLTTDTTNGVPLARIWGMNALVNVFPGTDAHAVGAEIGLVNAGVGQPEVDQKNSKYNLVLSNSGPSETSAALVLDAAGGTTRAGIFIKDSAITQGGQALRLVTNAGDHWADVATIDKAGNASFQNIEAAQRLTVAGLPVARFVPPPASATTACTEGDMALNSTGRFLNLCIGRNSWRSLPLGEFVK